MKIGHVIYDDPGNPWLGGGGAVRALEVNRRLARSGHEIDMLAGGYPDAHGSEPVPGFRVAYAGRSASYVASRLAYSSRAAQFVARDEFDLIVEDTSPFTCVRPYAHGDRPVIGIVHHLVGKAILRKYPLIGYLPYRWEPLNIRGFRDILTDSHDVAQQISSAINPDASIETIPNGVDQALLNAAADEKKNVLFLGRLETYQKGLDVLIEAFVYLSRTHPDVRLVIAGSGKDEAGLRREIDRLDVANRIDLVGRVEGNRKIDLLRTCLFCVMPSRYEGWPTVGLEAAACEKPVIGTDISGFAEIVQHEKTGLIVSVDDAAALGAAMIRLVEDKALRRRLGTQARDWARDYTWDRIAERQLAYYEQVLASRVT
jgi:glycosyltransferase involved in cell wall biosynthesis